MTMFGNLFAAIPAVEEGVTSSYRVSSIAGMPSYLVARSPGGRPALLVRAVVSTPAIPLRLAGVEARYGVRCAVRGDDGERVEQLSIVECLGDGPDITSFFCAWMDRLIALLGDAPSTEALSAAVDRLVAMFQALIQPSPTDVTGLIGELCVILAAADCGVTIRAWHSLPTERYDFVAAGLRMDVKATTGADRVHHLSADQASPPPSILGVLASVKVRWAAGGTSVADLVTLIGNKLIDDHEAQFRLYEGIALTLGAAQLVDISRRFDLEEALASLRFFNLRAIPALRPPFDDGISDVRFRVDLEMEPEPSPSYLRSQVAPSARGIFPPRRRAAQ